MRLLLTSLVRQSNNKVFTIATPVAVRSVSSLNMKRTASPTPAKDFLAFVNASPTPFHAVHNLKERLFSAGFKEIRERDDWATACKPGGKYLLTRNGSSIIAFAVGGKWKPGNSVAMVGTHTDSPCMRVKPVSKAQNHGYLQVGVEMYGGGLWHTWFDRDLGLAGRVMVKTGEGKFHQKLVRIERPILRIPTLAVHFDRQAEFSFSKENQLFPILGIAETELNRTGGKGAERVTTPDSEGSEAAFSALRPVTERHHARVVELLATEAGVAPEDVLDFECVLYDTQAACAGGLNEELVLSARLDNLMMTFCGAQGLVDAVEGLNAEPGIRLLAAFDNEEIGSLTQQGADSSLLPSVVRRLSVLGGKEGAASLTAYEQTLATSFLISADMAHAVHPNYAGKHEARHHPQINGGPVIKINANGRYTTNSPGIVLLREAAQRAGVPLQLFVINQDSLCGGTIGPMLAAKLGSRAVDLGNPQLSMHSVRETGGVYDVDYATRLFSSFYQHYAELEAQIVVD